jgi:hypothetical protein
MGWQRIHAGDFDPLYNAWRGLQWGLQSKTHGVKNPIKTGVFCIIAKNAALLGSASDFNDLG